MSINMNIAKNPAATKAEALRAAREKAATASPEGAIQKWVSPAECKERLGILFDDSGSMNSEIENAKQGVVELYRNSIPNQTAVAVIPFCTKDTQLEKLTSNLIEAAALLKETGLRLGGTPLFGTIKRALAIDSPRFTRLVLFTDGEPTDGWDGGSWSSDRMADADKAIAVAKELKIPIDTVFFGSAEYNEEAIKFLKYLAEGTGGYFLHFDPAKVNFRTAFKYLAAGNRLMLTSEAVRREIESGKRS